MNDDHGPGAATPHKQLIAELDDATIPKTEREHAASREIWDLREKLRHVLEDRDAVIAKFEAAETELYQVRRMDNARAMDFEVMRQRAVRAEAEAERLREAIRKLRRSDLPDREQPLWDELQAALRPTEQGAGEGEG